MAEAPPKKMKELLEYRCSVLLAALRGPHAPSMKVKLYRAYEKCCWALAVYNGLPLNQLDRDEQQGVVQVTFDNGQPIWQLNLDD